MTAVITSGFDRALPRHVPLGQVWRDTLILAKRSLIKMRRMPEQLFDVTLQPIIFTVMFTYIFGGAIAGDALSVAIEGKKHVLADLILLRFAQIRAEHDARARAVPGERAAVLDGPNVFAEIDQCPSVRAVAAQLETRTDAFAVGAGQGANVDSGPVERIPAGVSIRHGALLPLSMTCGIDDML